MAIRSFHLVADKVAEADYFLARMEETAIVFEEFRFNYSAFASAARSITFILQHAMHDVPGFSEWYAEQQKSLKGDEVARFFVEARNNVLKTGINPITQSSWSGPGIEPNIFWGLSLHDSLLGAKRGSYKEEGFNQDVRNLAREYLTTLLSIVRRCFIEFRYFVDPFAIYSPAGLDANGWTLEDVEENFGYPRGWVSAHCKNADEMEHLLAIFASSCDGVLLDDFLIK